MAATDKVLCIPFSTWAQVVNSNGFAVYHLEEGSDTRIVWAGNADYIYQAAVDVDDFVTTYSGVYEATAVSVANEDEAIAHIIGLGKQHAPYTTSGKRVFSLWPTEGSRVTIISPNWCDPTSWYYSSVHVPHETLSATTPGAVYQTANYPIIDTYHGHITGEDFLTTPDGGNYRVMVSGTVSGTDYTYTEIDPHSGAGNFTVDYMTGAVTFSPALPTDATVRMCYYKEAGSAFVFGPESGKTLMVKDVEVQFSEDLELTDSVLFQAYGPIDVYAPFLLISNGGPYPPGTMIPLSTTKYKSMIDFVNEANGALPAIPALGGEGWRGLATPIHVFPWRYQAMTALNSSTGIEVRIKLEHDIPFGGEVATATFYCLSQDE